MALFDAIQYNFTAGELSPRLKGRSDLAKYFNGAQIFENFIVRPHGGAEARGGTRFVAPAKFSDRNTRLHPFSFNVEQTYILEWGDNYIRFFMNQGQIIDGGNPYELTTTYTADQVFDLYFTQSADVLFIAHPLHPPRQLTRTGHTAWTLTDITFTSQPTEWKAGNYPSTVAFYEQRLYWASPPEQPQTIWGSKSANYFDLTKGTAQDDDALEIAILSDQVNKIQWMSPGVDLDIGTAGGEFRFGSNDRRDPVTPTNVRATRQSNYGSEAVMPVRIGSTVMYIQRGGRKLREYGYSFEADSYLSTDLTIFSEQITLSGIKQSGYANEPDTIIWSTLNNGNLIGCTYEKEQQVNGHHIHWIGGNQCFVNSHAVIDGVDKGWDEVWMCNERMIEGSKVQHIEFMTSGLREDQDQGDIFYVDSGLSYSGPPVQRVGGLDHLKGELVNVVVDGATHDPKVVDNNGEIPIDQQFFTSQTTTTKIHAGLQYESYLKTIDFEGGNPIGSSQGKVSRINEAIVRVYRSALFEIGPDLSHLEFKPIGPNNFMDTPPELVTTDIPVTLDYPHSREKVLWIVRRLPQPLNILSIMPRIDTE